MISGSWAVHYFERERTGHYRKVDFDMSPNNDRADIPLYVFGEGVIGEGGDKLENGGTAHAAGVSILFPQVS